MSGTPSFNLLLSQDSVLPFLDPSRMHKEFENSGAFRVINLSSVISRVSNEESLVAIGGGRYER